MSAERFALVIPGEPVGKGRPRFYQGRTITPTETREWERRASLLARIEASRIGWTVEAGVPLEVRITAVKTRPQRQDRRRHPDHRLWRAAKPDGDNVQKCVLDALEKAGVLVNDSQAAHLVCASMYTARGEEPRVEVEVRRL